MIDPALRRLLVLAVRHPYALVAQWSALGLTDEETAALLPDDVATAIAGLTNGATVDQVAAVVPALGSVLRWIEMWPVGSHPAPVEGEVDALVETYARRQVAIIADAIDLMEEGIPESLALRSAEATARRAACALS